jgi:hypothetical protein
MSDGLVPDRILLLSNRPASSYDDDETCCLSGFPGAVLQAVELSALQSQVTIFLQQLQVSVLSSAGPAERQ